MMINNKIYDLATQAGLITFESIHDSMAVSPSIESVAKARKFAELIVRECLSIVEPTEDSGDEWCVTLKGTAQEIREHFGVEE
jgi:hypothetical protein